MKTILASLVLFAAAFTGAFADTGDSTASTAAHLKSRMENEGYDVRDTYTRGTLDHGDSARETTTLLGGLDYVIAVEGAGGAMDVDVRVYDENGNLVGADTDDTNVGKVTVSPSWTGTFRIVVSMADTVAGEGSFVIQIGSL